MLIITVLQSASYASTASALSSSAGNKNVSSGGNQSDTNYPPNSGSEELSLTPSRSPSTSTARSAASSGYSTSFAPSSTLISPNLSHGRLSIPGYPETSVPQQSPVPRPSHGFNNISMSTPPARYYASQVRSSSSLGHAHLQQLQQKQQQQQPMTGSNNNSGESNQGRQQQQRFSSSSSSASMDFASFVQTSPIGMSSIRQTYHPHGPHQQRSSDQQEERLESLIGVASAASSAPTATILSP